MCPRGKRLGWKTKLLNPFFNEENIPKPLPKIENIFIILTPLIYMEVS
jgi:hypothetical protein